MGSFFGIWCFVVLGFFFLPVCMATASVLTFLPCLGTWAAVHRDDEMMKIDSRYTYLKKNPCFSINNWMCLFFFLQNGLHSTALKTLDKHGISKFWGFFNYSFDTLRIWFMPSEVIIVNLKDSILFNYSTNVELLRYYSASASFECFWIANYL